MASTQNVCLIFVISCDGGFSISKADDVAAALKDGVLLATFLPGLSLTLGIQVVRENIGEVLYPVQCPFRNIHQLMQVFGEIRNIHRAFPTCQHPKPLAEQIENSYKSFVNGKGKASKAQWAVTLVYIKFENTSQSSFNAMAELERLKDVPVNRLFLITLESRNDRGTLEMIATTNINNIVSEKRSVSGREELTMLIKSLLLERHNSEVPVRLVVPARNDTIDCCLLPGSIPLGALCEPQAATFSSLDNSFFRASVAFEEPVQLQQSNFGSFKKNKAKRPGSLFVELHVVASMKYAALSIDVLYGCPMRLTSCEPSSVHFVKLVNLLHEESIVLICRQAKPSSDLQPFVALIPKFSDSRYLVVRRLLTSDFLIPCASTASTSLSASSSSSASHLHIPVLPQSSDLAVTLKSNIYNELFKIRFGVQPNNRRK